MKLTSIFKNDGFITLFATLFGVLFALFLNDWNDNRKLNIEKEIATKNIIKELKYNQDYLDNVIKEQTNFFKIFSFYTNNYSEDGFISNPKEISKFTEKYPNILIITDSIRINNGNYKYKGELNSNFSLPQMNLKTIAWNTLKSNKISSNYSFEHLMELEFVYNMTEEVIKRNNEVLELLMSMSENNTKDILVKLKFLIDTETSLKKILESRKQTKE